MTLTLPDIDVRFRKLALSLIERSERGDSILIIRDNTTPLLKYKEYEQMEALELDKTMYTAENYKYLEDILSFGVAKLVVVRINATVEGSTKIVKDDIQVALDLIGNKYKTGWITTVGDKEDYDKIITWVKKKTKEKYTFKTIVYGIDDSDHQCVCEFENPSITFKDGRGKTSGIHYLPSLIGIASACNISRGLTYYICKNLVEVEAVANVDTSLNSGKLILINDFDNVRIGLGINSLTTFDGESTFEDMRYIDIVEAMHMISDDIREVYKTNYVGQCKNKLDNQMILISAINTYISTLAGDDVEVLDNLYDNVSTIDVIAQRQAWEEVNPEAKNWDDTKVKNMSFKRSVFIAGDIKILGAMENLKFNMLMN